MPIVVRCPECGSKIKASQKHIGQNVRCPSCGKFFIAEDAAEAPVPVAAMKTCPYCSGDIPEAAKKCMHCGETIDLALREAQQARRAAEKAGPIFNNAVGGGGGGGAAASSSSSSAAAGSGLWRWGALLFLPGIVGLPLLGCSCCLMGQIQSCNTHPPQAHVGQVVVGQVVQAGATAPKGTLQIQFASNQQFFDGMELFVDDTKLNTPFRQQIALSLTEGKHAVAIRIGGDNLLASEVSVKPLSQGITYLPVKLLTNPTADGKLRIEVTCLDPGWSNNLEMFLDGQQRQHHFYLGSKITELSMKPGPHSVSFKKNGVEVYSGNATVKKADQGTTFMRIDLEVCGTIDVLAQTPIPSGVAAFIQIDDDRNRATSWSVGSASISVRAEVGRRKITYFTTRPADKIWQQWQVDVEPGKTKALKLGQK